MDEVQFTRRLQSVGQTCFIKFFSTFSSHLSREDIIEILKKETEYTEKSCASRTSHALAIIRAGLSIKAMEFIATSTSPRVSASIRQEAENWANQLKKKSLNSLCTYLLID